MNLPRVGTDLYYYPEGKDGPVKAAKVAGPGETEGSVNLGYLDCDGRSRSTKSVPFFEGGKEPPTGAFCYIPPPEDPKAKARR